MHPIALGQQPLRAEWLTSVRLSILRFAQLPKKTAAASVSVFCKFLHARDQGINIEAIVEARLACCRFRGHAINANGPHI
jgi:hypothetical protein